MPDQATLADFDGQDPVDDDVDLSVLSRMQRLCYRVCILGDGGPTELANELEISKGTVGNHLERAREKLADQEDNR